MLEKELDSGPLHRRHDEDHEELDHQITRSPDRQIDMLNLFVSFVVFRVSSCSRTGDNRPPDGYRIGINGILPLFAAALRYAAAATWVATRSATSANARDAAESGSAITIGMPRSLPRLIG
jgi:hypothetical protein